jgi:pyruvate ferredoxin oxidoreductase gamma subunit/2-oxoisovalerate ferredoxin oxidoreductase gamma subunit
MLEIRLHGRGGQGAQVGCQILAAAFFRAGAWVQAFAAYGGERRGAPVTASLRVDATPIVVRCDVGEADHLLVLDSSLLPDLPDEILRTGGTIVVNSSHAPCWRMPGASRVVAVDASAIARAAGLGTIVSTPLLGAFAASTGLVTLEDLVAAVEEWSPAKKRENVAACTDGYALAGRRDVAASGGPPA